MRWLGMVVTARRSGRNELTVGSPAAFNGVASEMENSAPGARERTTLHVEQGEGYADRYVMLSPRLLAYHAYLA